MTSPPRAGPIAFPELATRGFLAQAVFDLARVAPDVTAALPDRWQRRPGARLVLLGQAGRLLWDQMVAEGIAGPDPCDEYSRRTVERWLATTHPDADHEIVYPGAARLPLVRLAGEAGWGRPSPLGLTIDPHYGPWIAHRIAFVTDAPLEPTVRVARPHPCDSCPDRPCVAACPVGAVDAVDGLDLDACAAHRVAPRSSCELRCLAREACPVGAEHRYGDEQMRHHYGAGLASIREHMGSEPSR